MNYNELDIDNNVLLEDLYDGKTWIHGDSKENIYITIFLITISGYQLKYALQAINQLSTFSNILVHVIKDIFPTTKAYNEMRLRCKTKYFVQLDEDMELFPYSIQMLKSAINLNVKKCFLYTFYLIDEYLGIGEKKYLIGLKLYNFGIMKEFPVSNNHNESTSSVDRHWHHSIHDAGYVQKNICDPIGYHAKHRKPFDLMIRFCKSTQSLLNPNLKKYSGDICRFIKPFSRLDHFHELFESITHHFLKLGFDPFIFTKNYKIIQPISSKYVPELILKEYSIHNRVRLHDNCSATFDIKKYNYLFSYNPKNIYDIFAIIGIIISLFEHYQYSYDKYPYEIYNYFINIFSINIYCKNADKLEHLDILKLVEHKKDDTIELDLIDGKYVINKQEKSFHNDKELIEYLFKIK